MNEENNENKEHDTEETEKYDENEDYGENAEENEEIEPDDEISGANFLVYFLWFAVYFTATWFLFGFTAINFLLVALIYAITLILAFSDMGEKILRFTNGVRTLETRREKEYLLPIYEDVYADAKKKYPSLSKNIEICIIDAMYINACALGRKTIAVTKGAIESLSEDELKGFIAHELGHIYRKDTTAVLLTTVGNGIFTIFIVLFETLINIFDRVLKRRGIAGVITIIFKILFSIALFFLVNIGEFILSYNSRRSEYGADKFAYEVGYADDLVSGLYLLQDMVISDEASLVERLKESHPNIAKRIGRLETMIDSVDTENLIV